MGSRWVAHLQVLCEHSQLDLTMVQPRERFTSLGYTLSSTRLILFVLSCELNQGVQTFTSALAVSEAVIAQQANWVPSFVVQQAANTMFPQGHTDRASDGRVIGPTDGYNTVGPPTAIA